MNQDPTQLATHLTEICPCNNCGRTSAERLYTEQYCLGDKQVELGIGRCRHCGLVYVSPRLTLQAISHVYGADAESTISHNYCWNGVADGFRFRGVIGRLKAIQPEGRLLDVGCGAGQFLAEAKRTGGWTVMGLEPNGLAAESARQATGCTVYDTPLDETPLEPSSFDVITLFGVMEHLHDPRGVLKHVHHLLKPGGTLAIYVPNFHYLRLKDTGLVSWVCTGRWSNLHPQEHLFQYTPRSVRQMLENTGFQCLRLDIGRPFLNGSEIRRLVKLAAYHLAWSAKLLSGIHLGGIEILACRAAAGRTVSSPCRAAV